MMKKGENVSLDILIDELCEGEILEKSEEVTLILR